MADYFAYLTIPANTPQTSPVFKEIEIEGDILVGFYKLIPPGWQALAHFRIFYGLEQLHPANEDAWDTGDDVAEFVPLNWKMPERKIQLRIEGYNEDVKYEHTVYLWFRTENLVYARPEDFLREIRDIIKQALGV
ncbi:MAG: hypothetical protein DRJ03_28635 [Chloroflexi bacterium]|nr:MAG: hypothetical protein DRJ03_28635 [Chloroflexota bacterium]